MRESALAVCKRCNFGACLTFKALLLLLLELRIFSENVSDPPTLIPLPLLRYLPTLYLLLLLLLSILSSQDCSNTTTTGWGSEEKPSHQTLSMHASMQAPGPSATTESLSDQHK